MIMKTEVCQPIPLGEKELSCFMFEEGKHVSGFIKSIELYLKSRNNKNDFPLYLMNNKYQEINKKEIYPILMDCGKLDLSNEKAFKEGSISYFEQMIFDNTKVNEKFHQLQVAIDELVNNLELKRSHYTLELQSETFSVKNLLKLIDSDLHRNGKELTHLELRRSFYDIVAKMNTDKKEVVLFILFPENHLGTKDIDKFMKWLKSLNVFIILLSNDVRILKHVKLNFVNLVKHNKQIYDLMTLSNELELFGVESREGLESLAKQLGYFDFTGNEILVNDEYQMFLSS